MKLVCSLLLLAALPAAAQSKSTHRRTATHAPAKEPAKPAEACAADDAPALGAGIPKLDAAAGCPKALYSLRYTDTLVGTGAAAQPRKWLTVNYTGYLVDGSKFDTSIGKEPITFPYGAHQVIAGWDTGFEGMMIGGKRRLYIPYQLAYGESGRPPIIPAKAMLIFDVELLGISDTPPAPKTPPAPSTPPPATPEAKPAPDAAKPAQPTVPAPPAPATADPTKPAATPPKP